jgi:hypothetical protein
MTPSCHALSFSTSSLSEDEYEELKVSELRFRGVDQQVRYSEVPTCCSWSALIASLSEFRT